MGCCQLYSQTTPSANTTVRQRGPHRSQQADSHRSCHEPCHELDDDVERGRVRVGVNGFENLEMRLPLQLPSGEVISVDLEYEKLEKHCFVCFSLRHEKDQCPRNAKIDSSARGINQENTLRSLEDYKKRRDMRRRPPPLLQISGERSYGLLSNLVSTDRRDVSHRHHYRDSKDSSCPQVRGGPQAQSGHSSQYIRTDSRGSPSHMRSNDSSNSVHRSQSSRKRPPRTQRNFMNLPDKGQVNSRSPALERLGAPLPSAQVEAPIELDRALALLGFASLSL